MSQSSSTGGNQTGGQGGTNAKAGGESSQALRSDVDSLKRDLSTLRRDIRETTDRAVSEGQRSARHYRDEAYHQAHQSADALRERINTHPISSLLVAICGGLLLGMIFGRK